MKGRVIDWLAIGTGLVIALRHNAWVSIPLPLLLILLVALAAVGIQRNFRVCWPLVALVGVYGLSLLLNLKPATAVRVQRFVAFTIGMLALSPMVVTERLTTARWLVLKSLIYTLTAMVMASFPIWIYAVATDAPLNNFDFYDYGFRGVFKIGMTLGPAAAVVCLYFLNRIFEEGGSRQTIGWSLIVSLVAFIMVVAAGSRIVLAGLVGAICLLAFRRRKKIGGMLRRIGTGKKILVGSLVAGAVLVSLPFAAKVIAYKNTVVVDLKSVFFSREKLWEARIVEFESAPLLGIGYAREFPKPEGADDMLYGATTPDLTKIEPGSSYLSLLSYGGILGAATFLWFIIVLLKRLGGTTPPLRNPAAAGTSGGERAFLLALLLFLAINALTEGWLLFPGSLLFPLFWLTAARLLSHQIQEALS